MAHFAELDENNLVLRVIVVNNEVITVNGIEDEQLGIDFCNSLFGGKWIRTSYNAKENGFRGKYAGPGMIYDAEFDEFKEVTNE